MLTRSEYPLLIRHLLNFLALGAIYQDKFRDRPDWISLANFFYSSDIQVLLRSRLAKDSAGIVHHDLEVFKDQLISPLDFRMGVGNTRLERVVGGGKIAYPGVSSSELSAAYFYHYSLDYSLYADYPLRTARLLISFLPYFEVVSLPCVEVGQFEETFTGVTIALRGEPQHLDANLKFTFDELSELQCLQVDSYGVRLEWKVFDKVIELFDISRGIYCSSVCYSGDSAKVLQMVGAT